jgi:hypothetical protein
VPVGSVVVLSGLIPFCPSVVPKEPPPPDKVKTSAGLGETSLFQVVVVVVIVTIPLISNVPLKASALALLDIMSMKAAQRGIAAYLRITSPPDRRVGTSVDVVFIERVRTARIRRPAAQDFQGTLELCSSSEH